MKAIKTVEEDGGLWGVYQGASKVALGYVFDNGSKVAGEKATEYLALRYWHNAPVTEAQTIGIAKTWSAAVAMVRREHMEENKLHPIVRELAGCEWQGKNVTLQRLIFEARKLCGWTAEEIAR